MSDDVIKAARDKWERDKSAWQDVYDKARDDLHFLSDDEFAQWDQKDAQSRTMLGRPAVTIDQLNQFVHQVANDIRQNTPTITVIPGDEEASVEAAEEIKGIIKKIEYNSNADDAYDTAANFSVKSSIGFIRVDHDYIDETSFNQQLCIKRVINPLACMIDSDSIECDGRDAKHGTIIDSILASKFKEQYPDFDPVSFDNDVGKISKDNEYINIAEHFVLIEEEKEFGLLEDGSKAEVQKGKEYKAKRKFKKTKVKRYKLSGVDILEETTFPGKYIPLVPVYGEEAWVEGKRHIHSLIRKSKQAQKLYNYWRSLETELLMKAPKAPVMAPEGSTEAYSVDWTDPDKAAVLRYQQFDANGQPLNKPERLQPPPIPTGIINAARETVDDIKATMGMYNASIGRKGNATSGIQERTQQQEGDTATFHFGDNLNRSITHVGRIIVAALPEIVDTPRLLPSVGMEDEQKFIGVNGALAEGQKETVDLTKGKYDVRVITGPAFTTQRQETVAALTQMFSANPELMTVFGDIFFKNSDFAGAQAMAERAKKLLPPALQEPADGSEPPDPEKIQMQQVIQQLQQQMQELAQKAQSNQSAEVKAQTDQQKLQLDAQSAQVDAQFKAKELEQKDRELDLKQADLQEKYQLENAKLVNDLALARLDAKKTVSPDVALGDPELHDSGIAPMAQMMDGFAQAIITSNQNTAQGLEQLAQMQTQNTQAIIQAVTAPKTTTVIRDPKTGLISAGVQTVQ